MPGVALTVRGQTVNDEVADLITTHWPLVIDGVHLRSTLLP